MQTGTPLTVRMDTVHKDDLTIDIDQVAPGKPGHRVPLTVSAT